MDKEDGRGDDNDNDYDDGNAADVDDADTNGSSQACRFVCTSPVVK